MVVEAEAALAAYRPFTQQSTSSGSEIYIDVFLNMISNMIAQFDNSTAYATNIQADIRKAFEGNLVVLEPVTMNEEPMIVYDETALSQISNASINGHCRSTMDPTSGGATMPYGYVQAMDEETQSSVIIP